MSASAHRQIKTPSLGGRLPMQISHSDHFVQWSSEKVKVTLFQRVAVMYSIIWTRIWNDGANEILRCQSNMA